MYSGIERYTKEIFLIIGTKKKIVPTVCAQKYNVIIIMLQEETYSATVVVIFNFKTSLFC